MNAEAMAIVADQVVSIRILEQRLLETIQSSDLPTQQKRVLLESQLDIVSQCVSVLETYESFYKPGSQLTT